MIVVWAALITSLSLKKKKKEVLGRNLPRTAQEVFVHFTFCTKEKLHAAALSAVVTQPSVDCALSFVKQVLEKLSLEGRHNADK